MSSRTGRVRRGGILPDLFVPLDTTYNQTPSPKFAEGLCNRYALSRTPTVQLGIRHASEDDFVANMSFTEGDTAFKAHVLEEGVEIDDDEWTDTSAIEPGWAFTRETSMKASLHRVIVDERGPRAIRV